MAKEWYESNYSFGDTLQATVCRSGETEGYQDRVVLELKEEDEERRRAVRIYMTDDSARNAARLLNEVTGVQECDYLTFEEDADTRISKDGGRYHFHVSGDIQGQRRVLNCSIPLSVLMKAARWMFGDVVLMGFVDLMGRHIASLSADAEEDKTGEGEGEAH